MATLERARQYFDTAFARLPTLVRELYALPAAATSLETLDVPTPDTPAWDLHLLLLNHEHPAWTDVVAAFEQLWPAPQSGKDGRVRSDNLTLGRLGVELAAAALESADKSGPADLVAAERWSLLLENAIRAFLRSHAHPEGAPSPAAAAAAAAPAPAAVPPPQPASPPQPAPGVAPLAGLPSPPKEQDGFSFPFALPPSRANTLEPVVQAGAAVIAQKPAQLDQLVDDFGGGFDDDDVGAAVAEKDDAEEEQLKQMDGQNEGKGGDEEEADEEEEDEEDEGDLDSDFEDSGDEYDGASEDEPVVGQKRTRSSTRSSPRKKKIVIAEDADEEDEDRTPSRNSTPARRAAAAVDRDRHAPSPSPSKAKAAILPASSFDPFDPSSWDVAVEEPPAEMVARLTNISVRQMPTELKNVSFLTKDTFSISHTDIGGGNSQVVGTHLCLKPDSNYLPANPGHPFLLVLSDATKLRQARARLQQEASKSISLFTSEVTAQWVYQGEYQEVRSKAAFLRGGAPFLALPAEQQNSWIDFLARRLTTKSALDTARTEWDLVVTSATAASIRRALETQAAVKIPYSPWKCTGFDQRKIAEWEAAVARRRRYVQMLGGAPADQEFLQAVANGRAAAAAAKEAQEEKAKKKALGLVDKKKGKSTKAKGRKSG
ncbi:hypothetical protein JCM6882_004796 [Rhodosporidiobolus microsporus]